MSDSSREFVVARGTSELLAVASLLTAIDRPYLRVAVSDESLRMQDVSALLGRLGERPPQSWSDTEVQVVCALYALGTAYVRLEQVGITLDVAQIERELRKIQSTYDSHLRSAGESVETNLDGPWWEVASEVSRLRQLIDLHYLRVLEIDGATWHRKELLVKRSEINEARLPTCLEASLGELYPRIRLADCSGVAEWIWSLVRSDLASGADPMRLAKHLMVLATQDPRHTADHATLMGPRGTNLSDLGHLTRHDFFVWVVFRPDFAPPLEGEIGNEQLIRKAMYAHHCLKKQRVAGKIYDVAGRYRPAGLADDLGARGIFFNENAHHRGHVVAGVSIAMRSLMDLQIRCDGSTLQTIHGLTDWRLSRMSECPSDRFSTGHYPSFFAYGDWIRSALEAVLSQGVILPPMIGEW